MVTNVIQRSPRKLFAAALLSVIVIAIVAARSLVGCPFCLTPPKTWAETIDDAEIVVLAEFIDVKTFDLQNRAESRFRLQHVHRVPRGTAGLGRLTRGRVFTVHEFVEAKSGQLYILTGTPIELGAEPLATFASAEMDATPIQTVSSTEILDYAEPETTPPVYLMPELIRWDSPSAISRLAAEYILQAPSNQLPQRMRLPYYLSHLEHADPEISSDAWAEFARSEYEDVKSIRGRFSSQRLRQWIADPKMSPERLGLYGMMLGLCGDARDAGFLRDQVGLPGEAEFRFGVDGLLGGFLLLTGEEGLDYLERTRIRPQQSSIDELVSVIYAMRFVWSYEPELISPDRLRRTMRLMLKHDALQEMVIRDLARWQDWDATVELVELYDSAGDDRDDLKRAVAEFMRLCAESGQSECSVIASAFVDEVQSDIAANSDGFNARFVEPQ